MHLPEVNQRSLIVAVIDLQPDAALPRNDRFYNSVSKSTRMESHCDAVTGLELVFRLFGWHRRNVRLLKAGFQAG